MRSTHRAQFLSDSPQLREPLSPGTTDDLPARISRPPRAFPGRRGRPRRHSLRACDSRRRSRASSAAPEVPRTSTIRGPVERRRSPLVNAIRARLWTLFSPTRRRSWTRVWSEQSRPRRELEAPGRDAGVPGPMAPPIGVRRPRRAEIEGASSTRPTAWAGDIHGTSPEPQRRVSLGPESLSGIAPASAARRQNGQSPPFEHHGSTRPSGVRAPSRRGSGEDCR